MGYGHGKVDVMEADRIKITMTNPLMPLVASGQIAGTVEALEDRPVQVSWQEGPDTTTYLLEF
jgi:hypothetical protein